MDPITFKAEDHFTIAGRGPVFTGRAPIELAPDRMSSFEGRPVKIVHPAAADRPYRVLGVESNFSGLRPLRPGEPVGLLVEPWA